MFAFIGIVVGAAVLVSGVVAVAYTATEIKNNLDTANSAIADLEASTDIVTSNVRNKVKLTSDGEKIIGLKDGSLIKAQSTLTTVDFDTTEYGDRAVLQLRNDTGSSITLTGLSIRGKPVKQLSGANGYVWEYSDYDDIEKNGENFVEVSNDFIFSPLQAKSIGDFVWKELRPHKMYSLTLIGTQYQYEIGQIWHLTLSYSLDGHTMEDIDTDVEVMGISLSRSVGGVGTTALSLRVPSAAWELTLSKNAKLVGAGNSQRLSNRSNIVTVASSTWTGQADYFCDGTNDEIEIQAAIDYVASIGGGEVQLTAGLFSIDYYITTAIGVNISGAGRSTVLRKQTNTYGRIIYNDVNGSCVISSLTVDGGSENGISFSSNEFIAIGSQAISKLLYVYDVYAINGMCSYSSGLAYGFDTISSCASCNAINLYNTNHAGTGYSSGFHSCTNITNCISSNIGAGYLVASGYYACNRVSKSIATDINGLSTYGFYNTWYCSDCISTTGKTGATGFYLGQHIRFCISSETVKYDSSFAGSSSGACANTADGGYNS